MPHTERRPLDLLVAAVTVAGILAIVGSVVRATGAPAPDAWRIAIVGAACGFGDLALLHLRFGHDQHSFTWSEIALVVGLVVLPAPWLGIAGPLAVAVAHLATRRPPMKVAFNALSFAIGVELAHAVVGLGGADLSSHTVGDVGTWVWLALASLAYFSWNTTAVAAAVAFSQGARVRDVARRGLALNLLVWACNTATAIVLVTAVSASPLTVAMLPFVVSVLFVVYRGYLHAIEQRDLWEVLHATSHELQQVGEAEIAGVVLTRIPALLHATYAELLVVSGPAARVYRTGQDGPVAGSVHDLAGVFWPRVACEHASFTLDVVDAPPRQAAELSALGLRTCVVAPLLARDTCIGAVRVGFGGPVRLRRGEHQVLDTIANHVAAALDNALLFDRTRAERSELNRIVEQSSDGIAALDARGRVQRWNPAMARITGVDATEAIGRPLFEGLVALDRTGAALDTRRLTKELVAGTRSISVELETPDGRRCIDLSSAPSIDDGGALIVVVAHDATERREFEAQLTHQALHDPLTGLPNRTLLLDRLSHALAGARRDGRRVAVLFCDLDRFKVVNDSLGHETGDALLLTAAERIMSCVRDGDTAARFGGDEFVVLCEETGGDSIHRVARRLARVLGAPYRIAGREVFVTASIGIAMSEDGQDDPSDLLRDADAAMYLAKDRGRDRIELFSADMRDRALARLEVENDLRRALDRDELRLHYQPYVQLGEHGSVVGCEALVRWQHPDRGLLGPAEFVALAEETGLIHALGKWVLEEACRALATAPDDATCVAVNVSPHQLADHRFVDTVRGVLAAYEVAPRRLCLEITETAVIGDLDCALDALHDLRALGVRLALDDFGTGYSALSYLRLLPVDLIKIDRSFVARLADSPRDRAIVEGIISLAHALGLVVVAEGVERNDEARALVELGCDLAQGFLFARPAEGLPTGATARQLVLATPAA